MRYVRAGLAVAASCLLAVTLWELAYWVTGGVGFARSSETVVALGGLIHQDRFWLALAETLGLSFAALVLGLLSALIVGVLVGSSRFLEESTRGTLNFARSLPSVILLPLFMASVGSFGGMVITLVAVVVAFKLVVFVVRGMGDADREMRDTGRVLAFSKAESFLFVLLPAASAMVLTGLRLSASRAYGAVVLAGVIAGTPGIGYQISLARLSADSALVLAYALVAGLVGVILFYSFSALERATVKWRAV